MIMFWDDSRNTPDYRPFEQAWLQKHHKENNCVEKCYEPHRSKNHFKNKIKQKDWECA